MMKKLSLIFTLFSFLVLASCSSSNDDNPTPEPPAEPTFNLDQQSLNFESDGGEQKVKLTSSEDWSVDVDGFPDWLIVAPEEGAGSGDEQTLTITADKNGITDDRKATIKVATDSGEKSIEVSQVGSEEPQVEGRWTMNALSFEGSTEQEALGEVDFKGNEKELDPDDIFFLNDDGTYVAGSSPMALNISVSIGGNKLDENELKMVGVDPDNIPPFLTKGTWELNEEDNQITFTEEGEDGASTTFNIEELTNSALKITAEDGYSLVRTAGVIPANVVDLLGHVDIEVTMGFERK